MKITKNRWKAIAAGCVLLAGIWVLAWDGVHVQTDDLLVGESAIAEAFVQRHTDIPVEFSGRVSRVLPTGPGRVRSQRFTVQLRNGHVVLVVHDLQFSSPIPLKPGDSVRVRGEYEWNAQGGVVHRTHRERTSGWAPGWVLHDGTRHE